MSASDQPNEEYLVVQVGAERYALAGSQIREVARWRPPTPVPGTPAVLPGIISQRGVVLPVVDLRRLIGLAPSEADRSSRLVIIHQGAADMALMVDAALDLQHLTDQDLAKPPPGLDPQRARLLQAVAQYQEQPLLVFDLEALVTVLQEGT